MSVTPQEWCINYQIMSECLSNYNCPSIYHYLTQISNEMQLGEVEICNLHIKQCSNIVLLQQFQQKKSNLKFNCKCKSCLPLFCRKWTRLQLKLKIYYDQIGQKFFLYRSTGSFKLNILSGIINFPIHEHCALLILDDDYLYTNSNADRHNKDGNTEFMKYTKKAVDVTKKINSKLLFLNFFSFYSTSIFFL